jgi:hypothetical protein
MSTADGGPTHSRLGRKEAKLALKEVLDRYGIPHPEKGHAPEGRNLTLVPQKQGAATDTRLRSRPAPPPAEELRPRYHTASRGTPPLGAERVSSSQAEDADQFGSGHIAIDEYAPFGSTAGLDTGDRVFHFLVRIAECSVPLHCQVTAANAIEARKQVEGLPNLIECNAISAGALARLMQMERAAGSQRGPARSKRQVPPSSNSAE